MVIVEDNVLIALDLADHCEELGLHVMAVAHSAAQARERFAGLRPDAVLSDLELGAGPDGADAVRELRAELPEIRVVFITAATRRASLERMMALRPDAVLRKPVRRAELAEALGVTLLRPSR
ncbi:response regulator [Tranquillimonas alkanivorans]|uniref:response regulator n=1 Tax=Tranquillimonas alkanivorans TaxID=441119 RepID=UPI0015A5EED5|nr:response regulator [Tranquillimonas alkanivorans]